MGCCQQAAVQILAVDSQIRLVFLPAAAEVEDLPVFVPAVGFLRTPVLSMFQSYYSYRYPLDRRMVLEHFAFPEILATHIPGSKKVRV